MSEEPPASHRTAQQENSSRNPAPWLVDKEQDRGQGRQCHGDEDRHPAGPARWGRGREPRGAARPKHAHDPDHKKENQERHQADNSAAHGGAEHHACSDQQTQDEIHCQTHREELPATTPGILSSAGSRSQQTFADGWPARYNTTNPRKGLGGTGLAPVLAPGRRCADPAFGPSCIAGKAVSAPLPGGDRRSAGRAGTTPLSVVPPG